MRVFLILQNDPLKHSTNKLSCKMTYTPDFKDSTGISVSLLFMGSGASLIVYRNLFTTSSSEIMVMTTFPSGV